MLLKRTLECCILKKEYSDSFSGTQNSQAEKKTPTQVPPDVTHQGEKHQGLNPPS